VAGIGSGSAHRPVLAHNAPQISSATWERRVVLCAESIGRAPWIGRHRIVQLFVQRCCRSGGAFGSCLCMRRRVRGSLGFVRRLFFGGSCRRWRRQTLCGSLPVLFWSNRGSTILLRLSSRWSTLGANGLGYCFDPQLLYGGCCDIITGGNLIHGKAESIQ